MQDIAKALIIFGIIFILVGILLMFMQKIPLIGRLPGDIYIAKKNFTFYFPLATSILLSIVLSFLFYLFNRK
ncbi:MAG: DUF2905 domain-containing protein [Candidatus Omnitrophica bacterium]|nr:DUF2905 domain-containing protein [Candidatus Omnitrophota bacterium]